MAKRKQKSKLFDKTKQYCQAQLFYLKQAVKPAIAGVKIAGTAFLGVVAILAVVLAADMGHKEYLEHAIGNQVLFVTNPSDSKVRGSATGFHIKAKSGHTVFVTNAHVCELANDKGIIMLEDKMNSNRLVPRRVLEVYPDNDLCVVEPLPGYRGLTMASDVSVGEPVWAVGYPLGEALNISDGRVKDFGLVYLISNIPVDKCEGPRLKKEIINMWFFVVEVCIMSHRSIQTDITIYGGNSGSPMVNLWGNVTGVIFASNNRTHWGSAVPLDDLKKLLEAY